MKKGFTLIELLAVIVILAVIALIASPIIIGLIDNARKESFKSSAYGIVKASTILYANDMMNGTTEEVVFTYNNGVETSNIENKELEYNGTKPESGNVFINEDGRIAIIIYNGTLCAEKGYDESEVRITNKSKEECKITLPFECGNALFDSRDGLAYSTVQIGDQCWMADNLKYTGNGCLEKNWTTGENDACRKHDANTPCNWQGTYRNWTESQIVYQWAVAQNSCPSGWHIPSFEEWSALEDNLVDNQGDRLKLVNDNLNWCNNKDVLVCGKSGFNALPVGNRGSNESLNTVGSASSWWTSKPPEYMEPFDGIYSITIGIYFSDSDWRLIADEPDSGDSVRCIFGQ